MLARKVKVAIVGAGSAGLAALAAVRRYTDDFLLIDGGELGTTCARVGCMPSKAAIHVSEVFHERTQYAKLGIENTTQLALDGAKALEHVRDLRDIFVDQVLAASTDTLEEGQFLAAQASFIKPDTLIAGDEQIRAERIVIATGSRPTVPEAWREFDPLTSDNLFELTELPREIAVIGLGVIGLEMGQALARAGVQVTGVDAASRIGGLTDPVAAACAAELIGAEFPLWLDTRPEVRAVGAHYLVSCGEREQVVDRVLVAIGRTPNIESLDLPATGGPLDARGQPRIDPHTLQFGELPIFIAGDVSGELPVLHEAVHQGRIAGQNAMQEKPTAYRRHAPFAICFSDPNLAVVGPRWSDLDPAATAVGEFRMGGLGRGLILGRNRGVLRVYAERAGGRLLGGTLVAPSAEHLAHALAWFVSLDLTVDQALALPYYHPVLEEGLQAALRDLRKKLALTGLPPELVPFQSR